MNKYQKAKDFIKTEYGINLKTKMLVDSCELETEQVLSMSFTDYNTSKGQQVLTLFKNKTFAYNDCGIVVSGPLIEELLPNNQTFDINNFFNQYVKAKCPKSQLNNSHFVDKIFKKIEAFLTHFLNNHFPDNYIFIWDRSFKLTKIYGNFENRKDFTLSLECAQKAATNIDLLLKSIEFDEKLQSWLK